jgi:2-methylcitrate dehydratase
MEKIVEGANTSFKLPRNTNQAILLAQYAREFMEKGKPSAAVYERVKLFHNDAFLCGISAIAHHANAPTVLRAEAMRYALHEANLKRVPGYAKCLGSNHLTIAEKAIVANCCAVREWDSNGTVFGFRAGKQGFQAGEFGHNDFYSVVIAAAQQVENIDGKTALKAMILQDEIRGRFAEVFSLKTYKIDHVVFGALASAVVYGILLGATDEQIESAVGMCIAHYIPFRAIRAGKQLSDSKGASAAISTEVAVLSMIRSMHGFIGPKDIFRNPESIFRLNEPTKGDAPFDLIMGMEGDDFAVMGMHFKLGLYEHQSAGALAAAVRLIYDHKFLQHNNFDTIKGILITAYEPAYGIIGDPAKKDPKTRQSADHSMVYIVGTLLRRAIEDPHLFDQVNTFDDLWKKLMLTPFDYGKGPLHDKNTRTLMEKMSFEHGGEKYDKLYPDGIPTSMEITLQDGKKLSTDIVMYPPGHARNTDTDLQGILKYKFGIVGRMALDQAALDALLAKLDRFDTMTSDDLLSVYSCEIKMAPEPLD